MDFVGGYSIEIHTKKSMGRTPLRKGDEMSKSDRARTGSGRRPFPIVETALGNPDVHCYRYLGMRFPAPAQIFRQDLPGFGLRCALRVGVVSF